MEGYDAADMAAFLDRALHSAARRTLSAPPDPAAAASAAASPTEGAGGGARDGAPPAGGTRKLLQLTADDVAVARKDFSPAAFWGVGKPPDPAAGIKVRLWSSFFSGPVRVVGFSSIVEWTACCQM